MSAFDPTCIDVEDFLACLDVENVRQATEREVLFSCPFPNHPGRDETPSAYMNIETTAFFCHSCHVKGNAIHFTRDLLQISTLEAIRMLTERYSPGGIDPDSRDMVAELQEVKERANAFDGVIENCTLPDELLDKCRVDWTALADEEEVPEYLAYMGERGFSAETLAYWEIGYDPWYDRITIPVRDERDQLVGFKGRAWRPDAKPKYLVLGDRRGRPSRVGFPCYQKSLVLFGLNEAVCYIETKPEEEPSNLIVVEGELNAIALWQAGYRNAVATNGSELSARQALLLREYADEVTIFFDSDAAGEDGERLLIDALAGFMPVYVVPEHDGDPASMTQEQIDDVLSRRTSFSARACAMILHS